MNKKRICLLLAVVLFAMLPAGRVSVCAMTTHTAEEAIKWMQGKVGQTVNTGNGNTGYQCENLIQAYYKYLGASIGGDTPDQYQGNSLPEGWERIKDGVPQKGDILIYAATSDKRSHLAIYETNSITYHQNYNDIHYVVKMTSYAYNSGEFGSYWGVIRPAFKIGSAPVAASPLNGVYQVETALASGKCLDISNASNDNGANLQIYQSNQTEAQCFRFVSRGDGYYYIINVGSGKYLDVKDASMECGANVQQWQFSNSDAQLWGIDMEGSTFCIYSKLNGLYLDVANASDQDGSNVQVWTGNRTIAQRWRLIPMTYSITYDANGGTKAPGKQTKTNGTAMFLDFSIPVRSGYTFLGWSLKKDALAPDYKAGGYFNVDKDTVLYAVWQKDEVSKPVVTSPFEEGDIYTISDIVYEIVDASTNGTGKVAACVLENKSATSVLIPSTVQIEGVSFQVTEIYEEAFLNCKKLKSVNIEANVKRIGERAFAGCSKLTSLTLKSTKLSSASVKNSLKNSSIKKIKTTDGLLKKYRIYFRKGNSGKTVSVS